MDGLSNGEGTMENKNWAKGKWTAWGKVRATSFNRVTGGGFGNQVTCEQRPEGTEEISREAPWGLGSSTCQAQKQERAWCAPEAAWRPEGSEWGPVGGREDSEGLDPAGSEGADLPLIEGVPEGLKQKAETLGEQRPKGGD